MLHLLCVLCASAVQKIIQQKIQVSDRRERESVMPRGPVKADAFLMFRRSVAYVGFPAVAGVAGGEAAHEGGADGLGDEGGGGDRMAAGGAAPEGTLRIAALAA